MAKILAIIPYLPTNVRVRSRSNLAELCNSNEVDLIVGDHLDGISPNDEFYNSFNKINKTK